MAENQSQEQEVVKTERKTNSLREVYFYSLKESCLLVYNEVTKLHTSSFRT